MTVLDWKDAAVVLLTILGYFLKDKLSTLKESHKLLKDSLDATNTKFEKFKSAYYVKMELHQKDYNDKFNKVYQDVNDSKADILRSMNADKLEILKEINTLSLQIKSNN